MYAPFMYLHNLDQRDWLMRMRKINGLASIMVKTHCETLTT